MSNQPSTVVALPSDRTLAQRATEISQATAVEQARAVAEVQSAVIVAQQVPRDQGRAIAEMREACGKMRLAERAFYKVPNRGEGPSVHLMRELARIWGNIDYGVRELRRDDEVGESEVQAYAWDIQTNTRSTRTFIAPHVRMKNGKRQRLTDIGDIYLSNQNVGARAVRECIATVLPTDFTEQAQDICRHTLEHGEGEPLDERISKMLAKFAELGVKAKQIEEKVGRPRASWTVGDVARMGVVYRSIVNDGLPLEDEFPAERVTAASVLGDQRADVVDDTTTEMFPEDAA